MTLKKTVHLIYTDVIRFAQENKLKIGFFKKISILLQPCILCIMFHRFSYLFYTKNMKVVSRFFWTINLVFFGADIIPFSDLGAYFYMPHPSGIAFMGKTGDYVTVFAQVAVGAGKEDKDIGGGLGSPVIGNNVVISVGSKVLGPIRIGNNVIVGACALVINDVEENVVVAGIPAKVIKENRTSEDCN